MPTFRLRARAAAVAAAVFAAVAPVAAPAASAAAPPLTAEVTGSCRWLLRGAMSQPVEVTVTNDTAEAYDVSLSPVLPAGYGATVVTPGSRIPAHGTRVFRVLVAVPWEAPKDVAALAFDVVTPDGDIRVDAPFQVVSAPNPPTAVTATAGDASATVTWTKPASLLAEDDDYSRPYLYEVTASPGGATTLVSRLDPLTATVGGLTNGTEYTFTVTAHNYFASTASAPSDPVVPAGEPAGEGAPGAFGGTLAATWDDASGEARLAVTGATPGATYDVEVRPGGHVTRVVATADTPWVAAAASPDVHGGTYAFRIRAVDGDATGPWSDPTAPVRTRADRPFAPEFAAQSWNGSAYLCLFQPWHRGGTHEKYVVTATDLDDEAAAPKTWDLPAQAVIASLPGLTNGHEYAVTVRTVGSLGSSDEGEEMFGRTLRPDGPPGIVAEASVVGADAAAAVSWQPLDDTGVQGYEVVTNPATTVTRIAATESTAVVSGLTNGTTYGFFVRAVNTYGPGPIRAAGSATPGLPAQVTGVSVSLDDRLATISWSPAVSLASPVTGYTVYEQGKGAVATVDGTTTSKTIQLASYGTAYSFRVAATNAYGTGPASDPTTPVTPADTLAPVVTVQPVPRFSAEHHVGVTYSGTDNAWLKSYDVRYRVARYDGAFGAYRYPAAYQAWTGKTAFVAPPSAGWTYCWSVRARDAAGNESAWTPDACTASALDDAALTASAAWRRVDNTRYYRSTYTATATTGATLTKTGVSTRRLAVVGTQCATCGRVAVYVGGTLVGRVSFAGPTTKYRQVYELDLGRLRTGTVKLVAAGRVYVDGLGIAKP